MRNNRRMLSVLLALCMVFAMLPGSVSAVASQNAFPVLSDSPNSSPFETVNSFLRDSFSAFESRRNRVQADTLADSSEEREPLTALTIGDTDAMITTRGKGWRLDTSTGVLTLSGASIAGTGDCGIEAVGDLTIEVMNGTKNTISGSLYGICVDGNLTIRGKLTAEGTSSEGTGIYATGSVLLENCSSLTIKGGLVGLISDASIEIRNSSMTIAANTTIEEAEELGLGLTPCGLFAMDQLTICEDSVLNASSTYSGIDAWILDAQDSTVTGTGGFYGIYTNTAAFRNCQVNAQATVSAADIMLNAPDSHSVGLYGDLIDISDSALQILGGTAGILGENADSALTLAGSEGTISGGYLASGTWGDVSISGCNLSLAQTLTMAEAMSYADLAGIEVAPGGICVPAKESTLKITDTELSISGGVVQIGAENILLDGVTAQLTDGAFGIAGINSLSLVNCPEITVTANNNTLNGFVNAGGELSAVPACISSNSTITLSGCDQVTVQGSWAGISTSGGELVLEDSTVLASGGYSGLVGVGIRMTRSNVHTSGTWTPEEAEQYGAADVFSLISSEAPQLTEMHLEEGSLGLYTAGADSAVYTVLDDQGTLLTSAVFALGEKEPEPADPVVVATGWSGYTQWTLTEDGVLTVYGQGNMKNYGYGGGQPWLDKGVAVTSVIIEEGVAAVGTGAFRNLTTLESVSLPKTGLTRIGEAAFYGCTSLKEIDIPDSIYTVFDYTFKNCTSLESVRLSRALIKIGQGAFENCTSLDYIFIPGNTEIIGSWSFKGCTGLVEADMQWADATEIREGAFKNCSALTKIHLPEDIQTFGDSCFYGIGAKSFTVPATVTTVEAWCFARAYSLKTITFQGNAPTFGEGAFNKITLNAYYPDGNATWTDDVMQSYGGTVSWNVN